MTANPQPNPWSIICAREAAKPGTLMEFAEAVGWALTCLEEEFEDLLPGEEGPFPVMLPRLKGAGKLLDWLVREHAKANPEPPA